MSTKEDIICVCGKKFTAYKSASRKYCSLNCVGLYVNANTNLEYLSQSNKKQCYNCKKIKSFTDFNKDKTRKYGLHTNCKECRKIKTKVYRKKYKDKLRQRLSAWYQNNKPTVNKYYRKKYKNDVIFRISQITKKRIKYLIKNEKKLNTFIKLLGCTPKQLKEHLENQFKPGMTWDNHGMYGWHIDHIKPCASFDLSKESEQHKCFHYTNLQPLWAKENLRKGAKYERKI